MTAEQIREITARCVAQNDLDADLVQEIVAEVLGAPPTLDGLIDFLTAWVLRGWSAPFN